jgi:acetolactate synthase-1/2/3 large subunit
MSMNGAESLVHTLLASGVDTCFANPGTSEMHFVAALDRIPGMRCVLGLFEGVVTGAADGYARMAGKPAATLLHCGPGLANGLANLHNARRANVPVVNCVGDQATQHRPLDAPLTADTEGFARGVSAWVRTARRAEDVGADAAVAVQAARTAPGQVATLILPSDTCWSPGGRVAAKLPVPTPATVAPQTVRDIARLLRRGGPVLLMLGNAALRAGPLADAHRIAEATGARLIAPQSNARIERGRGRHPIDRVPYPVDVALRALAEVRHVVLVGAREPVGFFAYPGKPGRMLPPEAELHVLARPEQDLAGALAALADELGAPAVPPPASAAAVAPVGGSVSDGALACSLAALLPEQAVVVDESISFGRSIYPDTEGAAPHDWLQLVGGAIGEGLPVATGAAIGAPGRRVVALQADGSAMYTVQALWTQARERLDVTTIILANRKYAILQAELANVGAHPGRTALAMMDLGNPALDWVRLAGGLGVEAAQATTMQRFNDLFAASLRRSGPFLIELMIP